MKVFGLLLFLLVGCHSDDQTFYLNEPPERVESYTVRVWGQLKVVSIVRPEPFRCYMNDPGRVIAGRQEISCDWFWQLMRGQ